MTTTVTTDVVPAPDPNQWTAPSAGQFDTPDAADIAWDTPGQGLQRDRWDRPLIRQADGSVVPYQRASTFCGYTSETTALRTWITRWLAFGLGNNPELAAVAATYHPDRDGKKLDEVIERALDRVGTKAKADWGTVVHAATEPNAQAPVVPKVTAGHGQPHIKAPVDVTDDVAAYWAELERLGIKVVATEQFVVNDRLRVAGTFDHVLDVPGWGLVVADKKTGSLKPAQHALQLAVYADGVFYDPDAEPGQERRAMYPVRQDVALLIRLPLESGRVELEWIDLDRGRYGAGLALAMKAFREQEKGYARKFSDVPPPAQQQAAADRRAAADADPDAPMAEAVRPARDIRNGLPWPGVDSVNATGNSSAVPAAVATEFRPTAPAEDVATQTVADLLGGSVMTLADQVASAPTTVVLNRLWQQHQHEWTDELTDLARQRKQLLGD